MSSEALIFLVASACRPHSQCTSQFQRGHHTLGSSLFETAYFGFSSKFEELASTEPSPFPQIPKASCLCSHISSCVYLPSQGCPGVHLVHLVETLQTVCSGTHATTRLLRNQHVQGHARLEHNCYLKKLIRVAKLRCRL